MGFCFSKIPKCAFLTLFVRDGLQRGFRFRYPPLPSCSLSIYAGLALSCFRLAQIQAFRYPLNDSFGG
jgi:hypothetical protein